MGLLTVGRPLSWEESRPFREYVAQHGVIQFLKLYHRLKDRQRDCLKWGDEIEMYIVAFDHANKTAKLALKGREVNEAANALVAPSPSSSSDDPLYVICSSSSSSPPLPLPPSPPSSPHPFPLLSSPLPPQTEQSAKT